MTTLDCGHEPSPHESFTTGYGKDADGKTYCYDCCAERERQWMIEYGKAVLYVTRKDNQWYVTDWPGRLKFRITGWKMGLHNIAGHRIDFWFVGPDKHIWHGIQWGEGYWDRPGPTYSRQVFTLSNGNYCRAYRTKEMAA